MIDNAHKRNVTVGMCGEMGGDPALAVLLLGLGIDEISASPFLVPKLKKAIRGINIEQAQQIAQECMNFATGEEVRQYLDDQLQAVFPDLIDNRDDAS